MTDVIRWQVFPVRLAWNDQKNKYDKMPLTNGQSWKTYQASAQELASAENIGIVIPAGYAGFDADLYKGIATDEIDTALGVALDWHQAKMQDTASGGEHYIFKLPAGATVPEGDNILGLNGFDIRTEGKGWLCSGKSYTDHTDNGLPDACWLDDWPELPQEAVQALNAWKQGKGKGASALAAEAPAEPLTGMDLEFAIGEVKELLRQIPNVPGTPYADWVKVGMACHHHTRGHVRGLVLWSAWSRHGYPDETDATLSKKWISFKGSPNPVTVRSLHAMATPVAPTPETLAAAEAVQAVAERLFSGRGDSYIRVPDALRGTVIGDLAARAAHCLEMPHGSVLLSLLGTASASVMTNYATQFRTGTRVALGLYVVTEQPPSTQKSRVLDIGLGPYQRAISNHNKKLYALNAEQPKNTPWLPFAFSHVSNATTAAIDKDMSNKDTGRFVIASAEQAAFQTLFPESGAFTSDNGLLLNGWPGEWTSSARAGRQAFEGYAWAAVVLFAQPGSIQRVLNASQGQGLTERFLFGSEPTMLGKRTHANGYLTELDLGAFNTAAAACIRAYSERVKFLDPETPHVETDLDQLTVVQPTSEGYDLIQQRKQAMEPFLGELLEQGELSYLGWLGKLETHVLKIAAVIHVFDALGNGCKVPDIIPTHTVALAMELALNIGLHMRRIIQDSGEAGQSAEAQTVLEVVANGNGRLTAIAAAQRAKNRAPFRALGNRAYKTAKESIDELTAIGLLKLTTEGTLQVA